MNEKPILVFQTDFTYKEGAVCAMYGVVKSVDRALEIIDGTHEIPKYDIWSASYRLCQSMRFWPLGTVFVSVVDPGVGTRRRACVAKTADGYFIVTPDNGTLTHVAKEVGITKIREIDESVNRLLGKGVDNVNVFHGRDLFAYCASRLASGIISFEGVGTAYPVDEIVCLNIAEPKFLNEIISGVLEINDPNFGNAWSNIGKSLFDKANIAFGDTLKVTVCHNDSIVFDSLVPYFSSFGYVNKGECVIYVNELNKISLALCKNSFCEKFGISFGAEWTVEFKKI